MSTLEVNSIQPLSSGTTITLGANGKTLDVPSGATLDLTGSTVSGLTTGKLGQLVQTKVTDQSTSSSDSYFDITGFTFNFTPSATTSNVYLNCSISTAVDNHSTHETAIVMKLVRDSTDLQEVVLHSNYGNWIQSNYAFNFYDTAISTTSQVTYKFQAKRILGGQTIKFNSGYSTATNFQATFLTAMEVLA